MTTTSPIQATIIHITAEDAIEWDIEPGFDVVYFPPGSRYGKSLGHFTDGDEAVKLLAAVESGSVVPTTVE